jgi:hypothetical protein
MKITSELYCLRLNLKLSTRPVTNRNPQNKESRPESGGLPVEIGVNALHYSQAFCK